MASSEEDAMDNASNPDEDLFGSDDESVQNKVHELSDRELDSGEGEGDDDRPRQKADTEEREGSTRANAAILDSTVWRHPLPRPFDKEVRSYPLPFKIQDEAYHVVV